MRGRVSTNDLILEGFIGVDKKINLETLNATENGTYSADDIEGDGWDEVIVNVPQSGSNIESISVTENGTYNAPTGVDGYNPVIVNVPQQTAVVEPKTITENGTYTAPTGVDGYSPVVVNVPSVQPVIEENTILIDSNGELTITAPPGIDGYSPINIITSVPNYFYFAAENLNIGDTSTYITAALDRVVASGEKYLISVLDMNTINDQVIVIDFNDPVNIPLSGGGYGRVYFTPTSINLFDYGGNYRNIYIRMTKIPSEMEVPND